MNAKGGTAVIVDVQTGDVLAMASVDGATDTAPGARPRRDREQPSGHRRVRAGFDQQGHHDGGRDPGRAGVARHDARRRRPDGQRRRHRLRGRRGAPDHDDGGRHPRPVVERRHDQDRRPCSARQGLAHYLDAFGFGQPTGLGLPGESSGITLPLSEYNDTSMGSIPIGYSVAVTAMQMLDVYTTIANHGMARPPRLVAATVDADGKRHDEPLPAPHQVVSPATAARGHRHAEEGGVDRGHRRQGPDPGLPGGGQDRDRPEGARTTPASTTRRSPGSRPPTTRASSAIVVVDAPQGSIFGADAAAPVFQQIMRFALTVRAGADPIG